MLIFDFLNASNVLQTSLDYSNSFTDFQPDIVLAMGFSVAGESLVKAWDHGANYDRLYSDITLALTNAEYVTFKNTIRQYPKCKIRTDHSLFIPNEIISNYEVLIATVKDSGFNDEVHQYRLIEVRVKSKYVPTISGDYSSFLQSFVNESTVSPANGYGVNGFDAGGVGGMTQIYPELRQVYISKDLHSAYNTNQIVNFFRTNRGAVVPLNLSPRHFGNTELVDCVVSDLIVNRPSNVGYSVSMVLTKLP